MVVRVLQESLMNIAKHSGSGRAHVSLTRHEGQLEMRVRDEGRGFSANREGRRGIDKLCACKYTIATAFLRAGGNDGIRK